MRVLIPDLVDRLVDKVARGIETDWQDVAAVLSRAPIDPIQLRNAARDVLHDPPSSVFDPTAFKNNFKRLRALAAQHGISLDDLEED